MQGSTCIHSSWRLIPKVAKANELYAQLFGNVLDGVVVGYYLWGCSPAAFSSSASERSCMSVSESLKVSPALVACALAACILEWVL